MGGAVMPMCYGSGLRGGEDSLIWCTCENQPDNKEKPQPLFEVSCEHYLFLLEKVSSLESTVRKLQARLDRLEKPSNPTRGPNGPTRPPGKRMVA